MVKRTYKKYNFLDRVCKNCNETYTPTNARQDYCSNCKGEHNKWRNKLGNADWYFRKFVKEIDPLDQDALEDRKFAIKKYLFFTAKKRAKEKGLEFSIDLEDIILPNMCPVLKVEFKRLTQYAISIDRIDSTKGYIKGNIQVMTKLANVMKNAASPQELLKFADWVYATYR